MTNSEAISRADAGFAGDSHFGDAAAIERRNLARYRLGMTVLAGRDADHAAALARFVALDDETLLPLLYDPVLRNAFEDDIARLENGVPGASGLGRLMSAGAADRLDGIGPSERLTRPRCRPWPDLGPAWVWTELHPTGPTAERVGHRLEELCRGTFSAAAARPLRPTDEMHRALCRGADLLVAVLPAVGPSVLRHVSMIGFTREELPDGSLQSLAGGDPLPSAIFMAPERLADPWLTAETLLHESLHLKLFDVLRSTSLAHDPDRPVAIPWRRGSWPLIRVLAALHVYVHLLLFQAAADGAGTEIRAEYGEPPSGEILDEPTPGTPAARDGTHRNGLERAHYLAEQAEVVHRRQLTPDGQRFVGWLLDTIGDVAPDIRRGRSSASSAPPSSAPVDPEVGNGVRWHRIAPVGAVELPEQGELVVAVGDRTRFHWLNADAWLIYALCDGRDRPALEAGYRACAGGQVSREGAGAAVRHGLHALRTAGLVEADPKSGGS